MPRSTFGVFCVTSQPGGRGALMLEIAPGPDARYRRYKTSLPRHTDDTPIGQSSGRRLQRCPLTIRLNPARYQCRRIGTRRDRPYRPGYAAFSLPQLSPAPRHRPGAAISGWDSLTLRAPPNSGVRSPQRCGPRRRNSGSTLTSAIPSAHSTRRSHSRATLSANARESTT